MQFAEDPLEYFVGREEELEALWNFVQDPSPGVLLVTGPVGVGKSFLLRKFAEEAREDGRHLICLRPVTAEAGPIDLAHLALDIAQSRHSPFDRDFRKALRDGGIEAVEDLSVFGLKPLKILTALVAGTTEMQREALEADDYIRTLGRVIRETAGAMTDDQCLVGILDADKYFEQEALRQALDHIIATLPERAKLILGMREGDPFLEEYHILEREQVRPPVELGDLARRAADHLITKHFGADAPAELVKGLIKHCGRLPLALDAGISLVRQSDKDPIEALDDLPGDCSATNLMRQLGRAALATERPGPDLVRVLALAREALSLDELTAVLHGSGREEDSRDVEAVLKWRPIVDVLERRGNGDERYRPYHDWMREAIVRLTQTAVGRPYHQALGDFYWERLAKDEEDERAIRHCAHHLAQGDLDEAEAKERFLTAVELTASQKTTWGLTEDLRAELRLACKLLKDETLAVDPLRRAVIYNQSGILARETGDLLDALAHFERVRDLAPQLQRLSDDQGRQALAAALGNSGNVYFQMGRLQEALAAHQQVLETYRAIGDRQGEARALGNIGIVYGQMGGRLEEALEKHQQALEIDREIGAWRGEANQLGNIGNVYTQMGRLEEALEAHKEAVEIHREIGYRLGEANQLGNIGNVYADMDRLGEALEAHEQGLEIHREIGYRLGEASHLGNIGLVYADMGRLEEAVAAHQQALEIAQEIGYRQGEARQLHNIGLVYEATGELERALDYLQQALAIFEEIGAALEIERAKENIARIEEKLGGNEG